MQTGSQYFYAAKYKLRSDHIRCNYTQEFITGRNAIFIYACTRNSCYDSAGRQEGYYHNLQSACAWRFACNIYLYFDSKRNFAHDNIDRKNSDGKTNGAAR